MSEYWTVRENIMKAIAFKDDATLKKYAVTHPEVFKNVVNQAKNSLKKENK